MRHMETVEVRLPVIFVMHLHNIYQIINHIITLHYYFIVTVL